MTTIPSRTVGLGKLEPGVGHLGLRNQEVRMPGVGEVLLEVISAGICGTDLHIADDEYPAIPPVTMGHEVTAEVAVVGEGVGDSIIGDRVAVETYFSYCERCRYCRDGRPNLCAERLSIGSHVDGGFARWLTVLARNLHRLPDHVGRHAGSLAEPLACVANCLFDPPVINAGDEVLVIGPGAMGLLTAQAARAAGGEVHVVGLERDGARLDVAAELGLATTVFEPGATVLDVEPDVVCECSGSEPGAALGLSLVRIGGRFVHIGIHGHPVTLDIDTVLYKELRYTSGFAGTPRSWRRAIGLLEQDLVRLDPLVTAVVPLAEWETAFGATRNADGVKYVLDPRTPAAD